MKFLWRYISSKIYPEVVYIPLLELITFEVSREFSENLMVFTTLGHTQFDVNNFPSRKVTNNINLPFIVLFRFV